MTTKYPEIQATIRTEKGTAAARRLRRLENSVPGEVYGGKADNISVRVPQNAIKKLLSDSNHASQIVVLKLTYDKGEEDIVCVMSVKVHDYRAEVEALDFKRIDVNAPIVAKVSLKVVGEDVSPGLKNSNAALHIDLSEVEVKGLPAAMPTEIPVDISALGVGESLHVSQLVLPVGLTLAYPIEDAVHDHAVVSIHLTRAAVSDQAAEQAGQDEKATGE